MVSFEHPAITVQHQTQELSSLSLVPTFILLDFLEQQQQRKSRKALKILAFSYLPVTFIKFQLAYMELATNLQHSLKFVSRLSQDYL